MMPPDEYRCKRDFRRTPEPQGCGAHSRTGQQIVWDHCDWEPLEGREGGYEQGKLKFRLNGHKLHGDWMLVQLKKREGETADNWRLIKERDAEARPETEYVVVAEMPCSRLTGWTIEDVAEEQQTRRHRGSERTSRRCPASRSTATSSADLQSFHSAMPDSDSQVKSSRLENKRFSR